MRIELAGRAPRTFAFGPFVFVPERQMLMQGEVPVRIGGRALDLLTALVERPGDVVSKRDLLARGWPDATVEESNLKVNMGALRRALGEGTGAAKYIATVVGRGYRFVAPVQSSGAAPSPVDAGAGPSRRHNLPTRTTRIFGRAQAIDAIRRDLDEARLVSIVGAGGVGKTTVALAVAERAVASFRDGVWLVDLALLKEPELVPNAIAMTLGVVANRPTTLAAVCAHLRDREMLLVLDSCEHVIDVVASCVTRILEEAAGVRILVTSRELLVVNGERVRRLSGLAAPHPSSSLSAEESLAFPAIQLFVERATDRLESFVLGDADAPKVAEICHRLDGLALAIELAATRVDAFGVGSLLEQLDDRFRLLAGRRAGPERHRTLTAMVDWSYGLLSDNEAALLRAVSVFAGVFDIAGAAAVSDFPPTDVADLLAQLAGKSLLSTDLDADTTAYRLLETTRTYCLERLRDGDEAAEVRRRHAEYVCSVLERAAKDWAERPVREWGAAYARVLDDLRGALLWAGRDPSHRRLRIRLTVAGLPLWNHFSLTEECRVHVERARAELEAAGLVGSSAEMQLQVSFAGALMFTQGPKPEVIEALRRTLELSARLADTDYRLRSLRLIGGYHLYTGEPAVALCTLERFASLAAAEAPDASPEGETLLALAEIFVGRLPQARRRLEHLREPSSRDKRHARFARFLYDRKVDVGNVLSSAQWLTGAPAAALRTAAATVQHALDTKHALSISNALAFAACPVFFMSGRYEECDRYVTMLDEQVSRHGVVMWRPLALFYRGAIACARGAAAADVADGIVIIERAIAESRAIHHWSRMSYFLGVLAEGLVRVRRLAEAENTIVAALERARAQDDRWCEPELLRIRATIASAEGRLAEAEALLLESIELARQIGAPSWRLRSANDLAALWSTASKAERAVALLSPIFDDFTDGLAEGFATRDLEVAARRLASLGRPLPHFGAAVLFD